MSIKTSLRALIPALIVVLFFWTPAHAVTITTGTTSPTSVVITGNYVNISSQTLYIYELTAAGTAGPTNSILLGTTTTTPSGGTFGANGGVDQNGNNFSVVVVLSGSTSYLVDALTNLGGTAGQIFFVNSSGNRILSGTANGDINPASLTGTVAMNLAPPTVTSPSNGFSTVHPGILFAGTSQPNASLSVFDGASLVGTTTADSSDNFSTTITLSLGTHTLTATQSLNGQTSAPSSSVIATVVKIGGKITSFE